MKKILVYIDAENITCEEYVTQVRMIKSNLDKEICVIGKVYGNQEVISKELLSLCLLDGFDFIDTAAIVTSRKNVADMKIVVDCIFDSCVCFYGEVAHVFIISKDCDFVPLMQKLSGIGISIELPLYVESNVVANKSIEDVIAENNWDPMVELDALIDPFNAILSIVGDSRRKELLSYLGKKKRRIANEISIIYGANYASNVTNVEETEFCLRHVFRELGVAKYDMSDGAVQLLNMYTSKMFGFLYPKNVAKSKLAEFYRNI